MFCESTVLLLEYFGIQAFNGVAVFVVPAVSVYGVDEKQTEHLDTLRP